MTTQPLTPASTDVASFVAQVRAALDDLGPETVDELTLGLEADLADARAESPATWREGVGSPLAYAAELRSAAGLPPRGPAADPTPLDGLRQWWASLSTHPVIGRVQREGHELAPAWWVLRGAIGGLLIARVLGFYGFFDPLPLALVALGAAVSVWIGRRLRRGAGTGWRVVSMGASALALLVGMLLASSGLVYRYSYADMTPTEVPQELTYHGEKVQNLYAFGADGHRLDGVRIYDQYGNQLEAPAYPDGTSVREFPYSVEGADAWSSPQDLGWWTPPMTVVPLPGVGAAPSDASSAGGSSTGESTSSTTTGPRTSSEESSTASGAAGEETTTTPSPRSTSTSD